VQPIADVATLAALGGVQDDEHVVGVGVHLGDVVARDAVPYGERMEAEDPRQHADALLVAGGMSTQTSPSSRCSSAWSSSTGRCSTPSSDTKRTSIPLATFQTKVGCA
jgi:hypothetical protein